MLQKAENFWIGTAIYIVIAFFGGFGMAAYAGANTKDPNQIGTHRQLGCVLWWFALACMWLTWATVYVSQLNPLLIP